MQAPQQAEELVISVLERPKLTIQEKAYVVPSESLTNFAANFFAMSK